MVSTYAGLQARLRDGSDPLGSLVVVSRLADAAIGDSEARSLFRQAGAPLALWPVLARIRDPDFAGTDELVSYAVRHNQVPMWGPVLPFDLWELLAAPTAAAESDAMWEYLTPLVAHRLRRGLDQLEKPAEDCEHLLKLTRQAAELLAAGRFEAAQALSSVVITSLGDALDDAARGQHIGANLRRPVSTTQYRDGFGFIAENAWVHVADELLILPAVYGKFHREDPAWREGHHYLRHMSIHGADNRHQYRPVNAARASVAAGSLVYLMAEAGSFSGAARSLLDLS